MKNKFKHIFIHIMHSIACIYYKYIHNNVSMYKLYVSIPVHFCTNIEMNTPKIQQKRNLEIQKETETETETERQRDRETEREKERQRQRQRAYYEPFPPFNNDNKANRK